MRAIASVPAMNGRLSGEKKLRREPAPRMSFLDREWDSSPLLFLARETLLWLLQIAQRLLRHFLLRVFLGRSFCPAHIQPLAVLTGNGRRDAQFNRERLAVVRPFFPNQVIRRLVPAV